MSGLTPAMDEWLLVMARSGTRSRTPVGERPVLKNGRWILRHRPRRRHARPRMSRKCVVTTSRRATSGAGDTERRRRRPAPNHRPVGDVPCAMSAHAPGRDQPGSESAASRAWAMVTRRQARACSSNRASVPCVAVLRSPRPCAASARPRSMIKSAHGRGSSRVNSSSAAAYRSALSQSRDSRLVSMANR